MANEDTAPDNGSSSTSGASSQITGGGVAASHPPLDPNTTALVAPATGDEVNTLSFAIAPIACWSLGDVRFAFDSSLVTIEAAEEVRALAALIKMHTDAKGKPLMAIFGHTDPVGSDDYNKTLSNRRARAIYGLLTQNPKFWKELYDSNEGIYDNWGAQALSYIRKQLGLSADDHTSTSQLFQQYMAKVAGGFKADPQKDFLGAANGGEAGGKADVQGCSKFNPLRLLPQKEEDATRGSASATVRNDDNSSNRRVVTFLFPPGTKITPVKWPCPTAREDKTAGCRNRFWSDGDRRRAIGPTLRTFEKTHDTFACRFYQRIANDSPCEDPGQCVFLKLQWKDPLGAVRPFPSGLPVTVRYSGGTTSTAQVGDNGNLFFNAATGQSAFTLEFSSTNELFIVSAPDSAGGSGGGAGSGGSGGSGSGGSSGSGSGSGAGSGTESLHFAPEIKSLLDGGSRVWSVPRNWSLSVSDWQVDIAAAPTFNPQTQYFMQMDQPGTVFGTASAPCAMVLDPHWEYMKFLYYDRFLKGTDRLSIPPLMVEGFRKAAASATAATSGTPDTRSNWITTTEACQCLPWVIQWQSPAPGGTSSGGSASNGTGADGATPAPAPRAATPDDPCPTSSTLLQFRTVSQTTGSPAGALTYIESSTGGTRRLVTVVPSAQGGATPLDPVALGVADPGLNGGVPVTEAATPSGSGQIGLISTPSADRLRYYDLPPIWKSAGYFAMISAGTGQPVPASDMNVFAQLASRPTTDAQPILFSLDDIVLTDTSLAPITWTPSTDRAAIFRNTFLNDAGVGPYKPDSANHVSTLSQPVKRLDTDINYIADYPNWVRLVIARGILYDVFDKRLPDSSSGVVGARAGVRWMDSTGIGAPGSNPTRPAVSRPSPFFIMQPFFDQRHDTWWSPGSGGDRGTGRSDLVLLRCCDIDDKDSNTEVGVTLNYFRFNLSFSPTFPHPAFNPKATPFTPADPNDWRDQALSKIPGRWTGPDGTFNTDPTYVVSRDAGTKFKARSVWFAQHLDRAISHFEIGVFQDIDPKTNQTLWVRGYMDTDNGLGALDQTDNGPSSGGRFVSAHETGHGGSLGDEYVEPTTITDSSGAQLPSPWLPGFDSYSPGSPYYADDEGMMTSNKSVRGRFFWQIAEWMRTLYTIPFEVQRGTQAYHIAPHPQAPHRSYVNFPLSEQRAVDLDPHGRCDLFFYPLGDDDYNLTVLPGHTPSGGGASFDGLLIALVKMEFDFDISVKLTIHSTLTTWDNRVGRDFNYRFCTTGDFNGVHYNRVLLYFAPRYRANHYTTQNLHDTTNHIHIIVPESGTAEWNSGFLGFGGSRRLVFPRTGTTDSQFSGFFREMLGLSGTGALQPAALNALAGRILQNANVTTT